MASISGNGKKGNHKFTLELEESAIGSASANTSTVKYTFKIAPVHKSYDWSGWGSKISYTLKIGDNTVTGTIPSYDGYATVTLKTGSYTIAHKDDGTGSCNYSFSVTDGAGKSYTCGNASASGTLTLTKINRYFSSKPAISFKDIGETTYTIQWSTSEICGYVGYKVDGEANWHQQTADANAKSGSFTLTSYGENTTHKIQLQCKRRDSGLATNSDIITGTTYEFPKPTNCPSFKIGNQVYITVYNPKNRTFNISMTGEGGSLIYSGDWNGTSVGHFATETIVANLYKSIPSAPRGKYTITINYAGHKKYGEGIYEVNPDVAKPIIPDDMIVFEDASDRKYITQNSLILINGQGGINAGGSNKWKVTSRGNASSSTYANITGVKLTFKGAKEGTHTFENKAWSYEFGSEYISWVNGGNKVDVEVTDSRKNKTTKTFTAPNFTNPTNPNISSGSAARVGNYGQQAYVEGLATCWNSSGKNGNVISVFLKYQDTSPKPIGWTGGDISLGTIRNGSFSLKIPAQYQFQDDTEYRLGLYLKDSFNNISSTKTINLGKSIPIMYVDSTVNGVGINAIPDTEGLKVKGDVSVSGSFSGLSTFRGPIINRWSTPDLSTYATGDMNETAFWCKVPNGIYFAYGDSLTNKPFSYCYVLKMGSYREDGGKGDFSVIAYQQASGGIKRCSGNGSSGTIVWKSILLSNDNGSWSMGTGTITTLSSTTGNITTGNITTVNSTTTNATTVSSTSQIKIPKNGSAGKGLCNSDGTSIIRDHNNKNVTVDATGGTLFLGYQDTTGINILNGKASIDANGNISNQYGNIMVDTARSFGARTGYITFRDGLKMQWGNISITPSAANTPTSKSVTFSKAFSKTPLVVASPESAVPGKTVTGVSPGDIATDKMNIYLCRTNTTATTIMWFAIGT